MNRQSFLRLESGAIGLAARRRGAADVLYRSEDGGFTWTSTPLDGKLPQAALRPAPLALSGARLNWMRPVWALRNVPVIGMSLGLNSAP